ncbi:unnamed protein product [Protopolystoma xenopodis]|uniref:Uncharacterized protein n=1 Tax=Protopolystoma xenopodis TaxID=117903 RepID=A0A3S5B3S9_9PLAT|nr:unnamed protein product [Protopolystoma xenopodis]
MCVVCVGEGGQEGTCALDECGLCRRSRAAVIPVNPIPTLPSRGDWSESRCIRACEVMRPVAHCDMSAPPGVIHKWRIPLHESRYRWSDECFLLQCGWGGDWECGIKMKYSGPTRLAEMGTDWQSDLSRSVTPSAHRA